MRIFKILLIICICTSTITFNSHQDRPELTRRTPFSQRTATSQPRTTTLPHGEDSFVRAPSYYDQHQNHTPPPLRHIEEIFGNDPFFTKPRTAALAKKDPPPRSKVKQDESSLASKAAWWTLCTTGKGLCKTAEGTYNTACWLKKAVTGKSSDSDESPTSPASQPHIRTVTGSVMRRFVEDPQPNYNTTKAASTTSPEHEAAFDEQLDHDRPTFHSCVSTPRSSPLKPALAQCTVVGSLGSGLDILDELASDGHLQQWQSPSQISRTPTPKKQYNLEQIQNLTARNQQALLFRYWIHLQQHNNQRDIVRQQKIDRFKKQQSLKKWKQWVTTQKQHKNAILLIQRYARACTSLQQREVLYQTTQWHSILPVEALSDTALDLSQRTYRATKDPNLALSVQGAVTAAEHGANVVTDAAKDWWKWWNKKE